MNAPMARGMRDQDVDRLEVSIRRKDIQLVQHVEFDTTVRRGPQHRAELSHVVRRAAHVSSQLLQERRDAVDSFVDLLHARREAQADVGFEAAVVAGDDGDVVGF